MRLSHIKITNFRALKNFEAGLHPFSVIIGENDVGKTSVLHALRAFFECAKLTAQQDYFKGVTENPVEIEVTLEDVEEHPLAMLLDTPGTILARRVFEFNAEPKTQGISKSGDLINLKKSDHRDVLGPEAFHFVPVKRSLEDQFSMKKTALLGKTLRALMKRTLATSGAEPVATLEKSLEAAIDPARSELQRLIQEQMNNPSLLLNFDDLEIDPIEGVTFNVTLDDDRIAGIPVEQRGAGTQNAIVVALYRFIASTGTGRFILALEEPENSFHPKGQRELLSALLSLSRSSQVICTTHSPVFIDLVDFRSNVILVRQTDGTTVPKTVKPERVSEVRQILGIRPSDALLKGGGNCAVLVEGQSEEMAFPRFMKLAEIDDRILGISILPLRGHDVATIMSYVRLLNSFELPCCLILDGDVTDSERDDLTRELSKGDYNAFKFAHYLKSGCLEDYYPDDLVLECLKQESLGASNLTPEDIPKGLTCKAKIQAITKLLHKLGNPVSPERLKDELALYVPERMVEQKRKINDELVEVFGRVASVAKSG